MGTEPVLIKKSVCLLRQGTNTSFTPRWRETEQATLLLFVVHLITHDKINLRV